MERVWGPGGWTSWHVFISLTEQFCQNDLLCTHMGCCHRSLVWKLFYCKKQNKQQQHQVYRKMIPENAVHGILQLYFIIFLWWQHTIQSVTLKYCNFYYWCTLLNGFSFKSRMVKLKGLHYLWTALLKKSLFGSTWSANLQWTIAIQG